MEVEVNTPELIDTRKAIIEMLFAEGNHFCPSCEKSGNCELQALAYRFGIAAPRYQYQFPGDKKVDATHGDIFVDSNRCVLCGRCVRASRELDGKGFLEFTGRGPERKISVNEGNLADAGLESTDKAVENCPVGALMKKRVGYAVPVGERKYDTKPIGSEIEGE